MKRLILLGCSTLLLSACGSTQLYTIAPVPVPVYLNDEAPEQVPRLVSVDKDFSSADERVATSTDGATNASGTFTRTYRWSNKNYMAGGVYKAAQRIAEDGDQPVLVNSEFQMLARFAAGDTYDYCWFDGHLKRER